MKFTDKKAQVHRIQKHYWKDEILEVGHYPFEQTLKMIADGHITDALTVLSLQKAWFSL